MDQAFKVGETQESGTAIVKVIKPVSMFRNKDGKTRSQKKQDVLARLIDFLIASLDYKINHQTQ